eukprot:m.191273 g.191273  ORF g.191273 m.191273 type:complete len:644 (+) comp18295_c0_seq1:40-1971(+)
MMLTWTRTIRVVSTVTMLVVLTGSSHAISVLGPRQPTRSVAHTVQRSSEQHGEVYDTDGGPPPVDSHMYDAAYKPSQRQSVGLWPLPRSVRSGSTMLSLDPATFEFQIDSRTATPTLQDIATRYKKIIFIHSTDSTVTPDSPAHSHADDGPRQARHNVAETASPPLDGTHGSASESTADAAVSLTTCNIVVQNTTEVLSLGMDESYYLQIEAEPPRCEITAETFVGAMYGMETLSQLVLNEGGGLLGVTTPTYWIPDAPWHINDAPLFPYRGLMVDTSRHFLPLGTLERQLDGMAYNKMNVLHWHLTDAQSTPLDSVVHPKLKLGAMAPEAVYTLSDIKHLVEYARLRGINVLVEIDMPGHSFAFGIGYPELLVNCSSMYPLETEFWTSSFDISRGQALYKFIEDLLRELTTILPFAMFHIGGDEVQYQCWSSSPKIVAYLASRNMTQVQLYQEFETRMFGIIAKLGKDAVTWDSTFETGMKLPPNVVIHDYQGGLDSVAKIAQAGQRVIVSSLAGDYVASQAPWSSIFVEELMPPALTPKEQALVLGGAAAMWGETMDDSDIDTIVWPDTSAVAERLWSPSSTTNPNALNVTAATLRLFPQRCRMYQRGIRAKPLDSRDVFGRRRLQAQCEVMLPVPWPPVL